MGFVKVEGFLPSLQCRRCLLRPFFFLRAAGAVSEPELGLKLRCEVPRYQQSLGIGILLHDNISA